MKYAHYDTNGAILGYYDDELHATIPAPSIPLTDTEWQDCIDNNGLRGVDATTLSIVVRAPSLASVQSSTIAMLTGAYIAAYQQPVSYTSQGGVAKTYQANDISIDNLQRMINAYQSTQVVPTGFYWVAADNTQVPFTYADMLALAKVIGDQGWTNFQHLQTQKNAVLAATTISQVQAIVW